MTVCSQNRVFDSFWEHMSVFATISFSPSGHGGFQARWEPCTVVAYCALKAHRPCGVVHLRRICPSFRLLPPSSAHCAAVAWDGLPNVSALGGFWGAQVTEMLGLRTTLDCFRCGIFPELYNSLFSWGVRYLLSGRSIFFYSFIIFFGFAYVSFCGWGFSVKAIIFLKYISKFSRLLIVTNSCW